MTMRLFIACAILCWSAVGAASSEKERLPTFFTESFAAVEAQPLVSFKPADGDETGTIVGRGGAVPVPPTRPGDGTAPGDPAPVPAADNETVQPVNGERFSVTVPPTVRIANDKTFIVGKDRYALASLEGLDVSQRCVKEANGRCMRRPMRWLKEAIAGRTLQCHRVDVAGRVICAK